jgi:hypothetical protein
MNQSNNPDEVLLSDLDNEELLATYATQLHEVNTPSPDLAHEDEQALKEEAFEDLQAMQQEILRRMTAAAESHCRMGVACPQHDGQVHGQEASELRTALEALLEEVEGTKFTRSDPWEAEEVCYKIQIDVLDKVDCRDSLAFEEQAAVEFSCSSVPELTPGTLEYQINQLSLANAQLVSEIERIKSIQLGSINLRGKLEEWIELKGSWIGLAAEVKKILDSTDDQEFEEFVAVDSIVNAVSNIQASLKVLTNMEKGTKTRPPVYRCPKCKEPLSTCELRRAGTLDILEKEPSTTPPWCESCVVHER